MKGTELAIRLFVIAVSLVGALACAWMAGRDHANGAWEARQAEAARQAAAAIDREWERGDKAAQALRTELDAQRGRYSQLEGTYREYKRTHSLLAGAALPAGPGDAVPPGVAGVLSAGETPPGAPAAPGGVGRDPALTVGAVWLWNEALVLGHAPASTCGAAGASETTCDAASGITLGDAWDNHRVNAQICADNRVAHQKLIDYIQQAQGGDGHD